MPVDPAALLKGLKPVLKALDADLLKRAQDPGVDRGLRVAWEREKAARRTGDPFATWRRRRCAQVSIAWVLSVVFVRTLEDRGFLARRRIAGDGAADSEAQFTAIAPFLTARDYLLTVFRELAKLPGAADLFDARHNPVWVLAPSAEGASRLLDFFRKPDKKGNPPPEFDGTDTRFLGDLYQNLSEEVRKRYALLQTPEFVEEFILEQTLDPAIAEFGLGEVRLIDPTCGSGHFLLGAFRRLYEAWLEQAPGEDRQVLAQRALGQVYGVDINPYAVAIARFRLTLEFLQTVGITRLERAPRLPLNLCVADSLLHGVTGEQTRVSSLVPVEERKGWGDELFALEDEEEALRILIQRYHAVVGNPPYITEKDPSRKEHYRKLYAAAAGPYGLAAPFTERFFGLAVTAGFIGMINANSFAKRDFGKALIEEVLPRLDLYMIVDTSGAYIPGHGTPTLLLFGRNQPPGPRPIVAVMGKRGEAEEPAIPRVAPVWSEIVSAYNQVGFDGRHVSVEEIPRKEMAKHPWVLAGGGARTVKAVLEDRSLGSLSSKAELIGFGAVTREDQVFVLPENGSFRWGMADSVCEPYVGGKLLRDWILKRSVSIVFPYDENGAVSPAKLGHYWRVLWLFRAQLWLRRGKGFKTKRESGGEFYEYSMFYPDRHFAELKLAFAFVSTHNHFILDRGGKVFNRSAPIIKLKRAQAERDHQVLLAYLNSSIVGFWCRLVMFLKGGDQMGDGARVSPAPWDRHLEYAGNLLQKLPLPGLQEARPHLLELVQHVETTVERIQAFLPEKTVGQVLDRGQNAATELREHQATTIIELNRLCGTLISIQEEIDWRVYGLFKLPTITAERVEDVLVPVAPEHRPVEVRLARELDIDISARIWFERHKRKPPADVGGPLADLYRRRLRLIDTEKNLQLLETPETKRRWPPRDYEAEFQAAYRNWLLDRIETVLSEADEPQALSARQLAAELHRDPRVQAVAEVYTDESAPDLVRLVSDLVKAEGVPYLAALRYSDTGLEKHAAWEETWGLQRREDAGEKVDMPVPPKYATKDYRRQEYWSHRGKLDVPKERFVLFPDAESDNDESPLTGWAGWDHLQKARALAAVYQERKGEEGWESERLVPLLAGLHELVPWLIQWHNDPDPAYDGQRLGNFFRDFVAGQAHDLGLALTDLSAWRPPKPSRGRGRKAASSRGGRKPKLDADALVAAVERLQTEGGVEQHRLAEELSVSGVTVGKVAKACIEAGTLIQTSGRPKRYRLSETGGVP